jgi:hypothetical protein
MVISQADSSSPKAKAEEPTTSEPGGHSAVEGKTCPDCLSRKTHPVWRIQTLESFSTPSLTGKKLAHVRESPCWTSAGYPNLIRSSSP